MWGGILLTYAKLIAILLKLIVVLTEFWKGKKTWALREGRVYFFPHQINTLPAFSFALDYPRLPSKVPHPKKNHLRNIMKILKVKLITS